MARFTEDWFEQHVKAKGLKYHDNTSKAKAGESDLPGKSETDKKQPKPRGELTTQIKQPELMVAEYAPATGKRKKNKTELRFEQNFLWPAKLSGELIRYKFERLKLILGDGTTYLPDYSGQWKNGVFQIWEVKGPFIHEDGMVKFNCAAEQFQEYAFQLVQWKGGEWRTIKKVRC